MCTSISLCCAARLRGGPGRSKPGGVFLDQTEGDFSRPDVSIGQPGQDGQSSSAVAQQEEEGELQEEEMCV